MPKFIPDLRGGLPYRLHGSRLRPALLCCLILAGCGGNSAGNRSADNAAPSSAVLADVAAEQRTFTVRALPAFESAAGIQVQIALSEPSATPSVFDVETEPGNPDTANSDLVATQLRLTIAPGETDASFMVPLLDDALYEGDETVSLQIRTAEQLDGPERINLTIIDDDPLPRLSAGDLDVSELAAGSVQVPLTFDRALALPSLIRYTLYGVSAEANVDFVPVSGEVLAPAGTRELAVAVTVLPDTQVEPAEQLFLHVDSVTNAVLEDAIGLITLTDEQPDGTPAASLELISAPTSEGTAAEVTLLLSRALEQPLTLEYATVPGDATGDDFEQRSGQISVPAGASSATIQIATMADTLVEPSESFFFVLLTDRSEGLLPGGPTAEAAVLPKASSVAVTIIDRAAEPQVSIDGLTATPAEPTEGTLTFRLSAPSARPVRFIWAATHEQLTLIRGSGIFAPGATEVTSTVELTQLNNGNRNLAVQLIPIDGAELAVAEALTPLTITDARLATPAPAPTLGETTPPPAVSVANANATETAAAIHFAVTISQPTAEPVSVNFTAEAGTARVGEDFQPTAGTLVIPAGLTSATVAVPVMNDANIEAAETLTLLISDADGAAISRTRAVGTILDDDAAPTLAVSATSTTESDSSGGQATFELQLSSATSETVTVLATTRALTAGAGVDFVSTSGTVSFSPGVTIRRFNVPIVGDGISEENEQFELVLTDASNATIAVSQAVGTIVDDDPQPLLRVADQVIAENAGTVALTVTLSAASGQPVQVDYRTADGSATSPSDFSATAGRLVFEPGETSQTVRVAITNDAAAEPAEFFELRLLNPIRGVIADANARVEISNVDQASTSVRLSWTPPSTNTNGTVLSDLATYRVYQGGSDATLTPLSALVAADDSGVATLVIDAVTSGAHCFAVAAINQAGNEGPRTPTQCWSL